MFSLTISIFLEYTIRLKGGRPFNRAAITIHCYIEIIDATNGFVHMASSPFMEALYRHMASHHYSKRTIDSYLYWIRFYIRFHRKRHPAEMCGSDVIEFLSFLAVEQHVSVATQKIALNALAFLYNKFLNRPLGDLGAFNKSSTQRKLPVVLTRPEVSALLSRLSGGPRLLASLLYGSGLRRIEAVRLRVNDVDFDHLQLRIWSGKGNRHRITTVALELVPHLKLQIQRETTCDSHLSYKQCHA